MHYIKLIRVHHWVKNLFVFIAPFFAGVLLEKATLINCFAGFSAFCFAASAIYIFNDIQDLEADRKHPVKKDRPIAAGKIPIVKAVIVMIILLVVSIVIATYLNTYFVVIILSYLLLNVAYCYGLKHVSIIDMVIVSSGFVFRTVAGGLITNVHLTQWLIIIVFLLSLFLALAKRRDDILIFNRSGMKVRESSSKYNLEFINSAITLVSTTLIVAYIMYTISDDVVVRMNFDYLYFTGLFVIIGVLRYLQRIFVDNDSSSPVKVIYTDKIIQLTLVLWVTSYFLILYIR